LKRTKEQTNKTIGAVLLAVLLLAMPAIGVFNGSAQMPTVLKISPASVEVEVGSDFEVDAMIETSSDVYYYGIILTYDSSALKSLEVSVFAPFELSNRIVDEQNGFLLIEGAGGPSSGVVPLVRFSFHCSDLGMSALRIADYYVDDSDLRRIPVDQVTDGFVVPWLFSAEYADYVVSGVPDFDQRQDGWINPQSNEWSWSGPTAVADCLWWLDSSCELCSLAPPAISDGLRLVHAYGSWDDHDSQNAPLLIEDLAWCMDTDGNRTEQRHNGTVVDDLVEGVKGYFSEVELTDKFSVQAVKAPTFDDIRREVERGEAAVLLFGFWQEQPEGSGTLVRVGGHYVAVSGFDPSNSRLAFSDPYGDNAEMTGLGFVKPTASHDHPMVPPDTMHNDAALVSHDFYNATYESDAVGESRLGILYNPTYLTDLVNDTQGQNTPVEFESFQGGFDPLSVVKTEVEYAIVVSCKTGLVAAGTEGGSVNVWDFYGSLQWSWNSSYPIVSVAMTNDGRYAVAGSRLSSVPGAGSLLLFDNSLGSPPSNSSWPVSIPVSKGQFGDFSGLESESVDVKNNTFNGFVVVAAATDSGVSLFNCSGGVIWNYSDGSAESMVTFSDDGNYLLCCSVDSGVLHYFSSFRDGIAGWSAGDGMPVWSYGGAAFGLYGYWVGLDGLGGCVAASMYPTPVSVSQDFSRVVLLNGAGEVLWSRGLSKGGFVKVEVSCDGKRVAAVNSDPDDTVGCDVTCWSELTDGLSGWGVDDSVPSWVFWPGKEFGQPNNVSDDLYSLGMSEDGRSVTIGGSAANVYFLSSDGEEVVNITGAQGVVESVDLTFDGKYGVIGDDAGRLRLFDCAAGLKWSAIVDGGVSSVALSKVYPNPSVNAECDMAVINTTGCKDGCSPLSTVTQNNTCHFWVEVENQGDIPASVTISIRVNGSLIGTVTINVSTGEKAIVPFVWNTTGFARGNYTITGLAEISQGEADVCDNIFADAYVLTLSGAGDVNGDSTVDLRDVGFITSSYSTRPGAAKWNPNADLNDDHIVDMRDMGIACNNFGKIYS
jgi:hypothetical protein